MRSSAATLPVCDVYDALISERPYKLAWSQAQAVAELQKQAGKQFDPRVVACFLTLLREKRLATLTA